MLPRHKVLRGLHRHSHRFGKLRRVTQALTLAVLFALPALGVARFDAWRGGHVAFGEPSNAIMAFGYVIVSIVGFYVVTFVLNAALGRVFCGFGCPVGQTARLADDVDAAKKRGAKAKAWARHAGFAIVLAAAVLTWWVDPRVLWLGSGAETAIAITAWALLSLAIVGHGRWWRFGFCKSWCPIGVYYSAVQTEHRFGIGYDASACDDCDACVKVCPVDLNPKDLPNQTIADRGGLSIDDFPATNHCLTCGDCVQACELVSIPRHGDGLIALRLSFDGKPRRKASHDGRDETLDEAA